MRKTAVAFLFAAILSSACQRSNAYKHDQDYYQPDNSTSYYNNKSGQTASQRVEQMGQPKKRIVVLNFWNDTPVKEGALGGFAADELRRGLSMTRRMIISPDVKSDLVTDDFIQGDQIKVAQLVREGRRLGVAVILIGRLKKIVFRSRGDDVGLLRQKQSLAGADLEIKAFDVASGRELMASSRSGEASSNAVLAVEDQDLESPAYRTELSEMAIRNAVALLVPDVVHSIEKLTWQGRIAKVVGTKVYVNAGKASGLVVGDILRVMAPGDDVYDPTSGAFLGHTQGQLKGTLEVLDFLGTDGAVTEVHTGGNFAENDTVQLY
jgi:hypothetical protein